MRKRQGFTLVELLVTVGIIAILIGMLLPTLNRARESARQVKCASNIRQLADAFMMYTNDNRQWFPCVAVYGGTLGYGAATPLPGTTDWWGWSEDWIVWRHKHPSDPLAGSIVQYLNSPGTGDIMCCPSDPHVRTYTDPAGDYPYSYVMNSYLSYGTNYNPEAGFTPPNVKKNLKYANDQALRITDVVDSSEKILLYEEDENAIRDGRGQLQSPAFGTGAVIGLLAIRHDSTRITPDVAPGTTEGIESTVNREGRGNVGFVDGHVEYVTRMFAHNQLHYDPKYQGP